MIKIQKKIKNNILKVKLMSDVMSIVPRVGSFIPRCIGPPLSGYPGSCGSAAPLIFKSAQSLMGQLLKGLVRTLNADKDRRKRPPELRQYA